ncbi:MAG TPA: sigma-70 family RNA polymerase sigma factor [Flavipsychrobacter sp.]|nr:sigma-70 family RNA polymerase sigma factor [Flavipsychrobacter sp.]
MQDSLSDHQIIAFVLQGKKEAYRLLVSRYQSYVFSLALKYLPVREEAEEAAQDVFVKAYKGLATYRAEAKFTTWLYSIAYTTCISHARKKTGKSVSMNEEQLLQIDNIPLLPDLVDRRSKAVMLDVAIRQLNTEDATIVTLYYTASQTLDEIGRIMEINPNAAKVKLFRARQKLRDILVRSFPQELQEYNYLKNDLN